MKRRRQLLLLLKIEYGMSKPAPLVAMSIAVRMLASTIVETDWLAPWILS